MILALNRIIYFTGKKMVNRKVRVTSMYSSKYRIIASVSEINAMLKTLTEIVHTLPRI